MLSKLVFCVLFMEKSIKHHPKNQTYLWAILYISILWFEADIAMRYKKAFYRSHGSHEIEKHQ